MRRSAQLTVGVALLLLAGACAAASLIGYFGGAALNINLGASATVPDCTTSPTDQATCVTAVEGEGFVASVVSGCSAIVSSGDVIATTPTAGSSAEIGSTVVLRVSTGVCTKGRGRKLGLGLGIGQ